MALRSEMPTSRSCMRVIMERIQGRYGEVKASRFEALLPFCEEKPSRMK
jgi:hypothetical protein